MARRTVPEWREVLDAVQRLDHVGAGPVGYWGVSLGCGLGVPFVAAEPRVRAAVLGLGGLSVPGDDTASRITVPVDFLLQWDDERVPRADGLALFDALASVDKTLHANPGKHAEIPELEAGRRTEILLPAPPLTRPGTHAPIETVATDALGRGRRGALRRLSSHQVPLVGMDCRGTRGRTPRRVAPGGPSDRRRPVISADQRRREQPKGVRMTDSARTVLAGLDRIRDDIEDLYKDLHRNPELGLEEHRTARKAADLLRGLGCRVVEGIGGTGVVGVLTNGDGPTVMVRADMDALPVREQTGLPYASTVTVAGRDGTEQPVMHACGHDVHIASLIGCVRLLAESTGAWKGTFVALLQPSEERGDGADAMVADGLTAKAPRPDVVLAQHVLPYPAGYVGTRAGSFMSAADSLRITVHGRGGHGAMPQTAVDPVVMAAMIVVRLQTIVSREIAALTPVVVTVGSIHAGTGPNIIPDRAVIQVNVRTYDDHTRTHVLQAIERIVTAECQASGAPKPPEIEKIVSFPPRSTTPRRPGASPRCSPSTSAPTRTPSTSRPRVRT